MTKGTATASHDSEGRDDRGAVELSYVRYRGQRWFVSGAGRWEPRETVDPETLEARRTAIGLEPMTAYIARFNCR